MKTRSTSLFLAVSATLALAACGSKSAVGPTPPSTYNLDLLISSVGVSDNCEDAGGNPGEWAWKIDVRTPTRFAWASTDNYPSASGAVSWFDNAIYTINQVLRFTDIPEADTRQVTITLRATEWDGDTPDPDMNGRSVTNQVAFSLTGGNQFIGIDSGRCDLQFIYRATFAKVE